MVRLSSQALFMTKCCKIQSTGRKREAPRMSLVSMLRKSRRRPLRFVYLVTVTVIANTTPLVSKCAIQQCSKQAPTTSLHARSPSTECGAATRRISMVSRSVMLLPTPSHMKPNSTTACSEMRQASTFAWANSEI